MAVDSTQLFDWLSICFEKAVDASQENLVLTITGYGAISWLVWSVLQSIDCSSDSSKQRSQYTTIEKTDETMDWFVALKEAHATSVLNVKEWVDDGGVYRRSGGWKGNDYMHAPTSPVRIYDYILFPAGELKGVTDDISDHAILSAVYFSVSAESHKGLCHGGTMCAVMDDAIGWCGFCESGSCRPWSGYTVQIDTSLKRAIPVESVLKVIAWIERREGKRKVYISAKLVSIDGKTVHATGNGLFLKTDSETSDSL